MMLSVAQLCLTCYLLTCSIVSSTRIGGSQVVVHVYQDLPEPTNCDEFYHNFEKYLTVFSDGVHKVTSHKIVLDTFAIVLPRIWQVTCRKVVIVSETVPYDIWMGPEDTIVTNSSDFENPDRPFTQVTRHEAICNQTGRFIVMSLDRIIYLDANYGESETYELVYDWLKYDKWLLFPDDSETEFRSYCQTPVDDVKTHVRSFLENPKYLPQPMRPRVFTYYRQHRPQFDLSRFNATIHLQIDDWNGNYLRANLFYDKLAVRRAIVTATVRLKSPPDDLTGTNKSQISLVTQGTGKDVYQLEDQGNGTYLSPMITFNYGLGEYIIYVEVDSATGYVVRHPASKYPIVCCHGFILSSTESDSEAIGPFTTLVQPIFNYTLKAISQPFVRAVRSSAPSLLASCLILGVSGMFTCLTMSCY